MKKLNIEFQELPYAVEEAMNRLRINISSVVRTQERYS